MTWVIKPGLPYQKQTQKFMKQNSQSFKYQGMQLKIKSIKKMIKKQNK